MRRHSGIYISLILGVTFCILLFSSGHAARFDEGLKSRIDQINSAIYNDRFDRADSLIDSLDQYSNPLPFKHLYRAILSQTRMMAAESDWLESELFLALDSVEHYANRIFASEEGTPDDSAFAYYFLGQAYAFRSLYEGRAGHLWSAVKKGRAAGQAFTDGFKIDSTFYDMSLGLGSYWYWKSVKTKMINWTPLFKNEKKKGIAHLLRAVDSSELSVEPAKSALIWVYINEKKYDEAIRLAEQLYQKYPEGLTFLYGLAQAYYNRGDFQKAERYYLKIWKRLKDSPGNFYNVIEVGYYLSNCYRALAKTDPEIVDQIDKIRLIIEKCPIPEEVRKRQKKKIKQILKN